MKKASLILIFTALTALVTLDIRRLFARFKKVLLIYLTGLAIVLPQMAFAQGAGKALNFDGTNDYVDCGNDASLNPTTAITIEAWVKTAESKTARIAEKGDWDGHGIYQDKWNGWKGAIHIDGGNGYSIKWNKGVPTFNQWYHIALTYDGSALRLYVDGVEKNNISPVNGNLRINSRDFTIGSNGGAQKFFKGTIDEVCIWNVALTEAQIRETMCKKINSGNLPSGLLWSSLKGYWRFDESSETSCTDYSSNGNTGTMHNMDPATDRVWSTAAFGDEGERKIGSTPNVPTSDNLDLYLNFTNGVGSEAILAAIENNEVPVDGTKPTDNISERYWDIQFLNTDGDDIYSANAQFYWSGLGIMGPEKAFRLLSRPSAGENWSEVSSYSIDETNDYFQTTATSFTQFAMGYNDPATFVYPGFPKAKYVLLGVPVIPSNGNPNSVLADDFDNKTAGVDWRLTRWNVQHNTYIRFNETDADGQEHGDPPDFSPGKGYWIYQNVLNTTDIDVEGYEVSQGQDFSIPLDAPIDTNRGLNMTSNPFNFKIDWSNSKISDGSETKSIEDAATAGWVSQYAYTWDSNNSQYVPLTPDDGSNADTISAWRGFWTIQMDDSRSCELLVPPTKILGKKSAPLPQWLSDHLEKGANHLPAQSQESWFLKLSVRSESGDIRDTYNGLGVSQDALSEYDHHDAFEFTPNATEFVMLYFPHNDPEDVENYWQDQPYRYTYDIRNTDWEQAEWLFKVYQYGAPGDYRLNWSGMRLIPQTVRLSLCDAETGDEIADLRQSREINFNLSDGEQSRSFEIRAELVEDNISPEFTIGITQNPILTYDIDIYVLPSEKLTNIMVDVNGVELEMIEIDPMNIVYRCDYELEGSGNFTINVSGRDLSDNDGEGSVTFSAQLMKSVSGGTIQSPDAVLRLKVPARAIENDKYITVFSEAGEAEWSGLNGIGRCYRINPKSNFLKESEISFSYNENEININNESNLSIYIRDGLEWVRISSEVDRVENRVTGMINRSGVYRLFHTPAEEIIKAIPDRYSLKQNYPNPFNATTIIRYQLPEETKVIIKMYNVLGQEVKVLVSELQSSGCYSVQWDGTNRFGLVVPSGVYFYCLESKGFRATKKLLLIK